MFSYNIGIKKYYNIKDNFETRVSFGQGKLLAQGTLCSFSELTLEFLKAQLD
jgi:hypothetical protein